MEFTINGTSVPQVEKYDNQGAHQCHQVNDAEKRNT